MGVDGVKMAAALLPPMTAACQLHVRLSERGREAASGREREGLVEENLATCFPFYSTAEFLHHLQASSLQTLALAYMLDKYSTLTSD